MHVIVMFVLTKVLEVQGGVGLMVGQVKLGRQALLAKHLQVKSVLLATRLAHLSREH